MSNYKNYTLEVSPSQSIENEVPPDRNLIKFSVKPPKSGFIKHIQKPLSFILFVSFTLTLYKHVCGSDLCLVDVNVFSRNYKVPADLCASLLMLLSCISRREQEESILFIRDIGIQLESKGNWRFERAKKIFISSDEIIDLIIHEGFKGFGVIFYMAILVKNSKKLEIVFPTLLPRRGMLEVVWKNGRKVLFANNDKATL